MLIFMVVQLAGSAGTYPVEISPSFVAKIHNYLPFTYTVNAFRSTIAGGRKYRNGSCCTDCAGSYIYSADNLTV